MQPSPLSCTARLVPAARAALAALALTLGTACVVVPQTRETYDAECRTMRKQMTLETAVVGGFQRCSGDGCVALLAAAGAVTAATAVVSGSIALVGNVVYWFERQGRCNARPAGGSAAPAAPASASR
jgi:hypothetical protein